MFFLIEKPGFCEFFEIIDEFYPLLSHNQYLQNIFFIFFFANLNNYQTSDLQSFWNLIIKKSKTNEQTKMNLLNGLSILLNNYIFCLKSLSDDKQFLVNLSVLHNQTFHFLTPDLLTATFLNIVCQINITTLLDNSATLIIGMEFFYEVFNLLKENNLKTRIISFLQFLFEKKEIILKLFIEQATIKNILYRAFLEENHTIFLNFLNHFNEKIIQDEGVNYFYRNTFFREIKSFMNDIQTFNFSNEFKNKIMVFLCIFFQRIGIGSEKINCIEIFQTKKNDKFNEDFTSDKVYFII